MFFKYKHLLHEIGETCFIWSGQLGSCIHGRFETAIPLLQERVEFSF